MMRRLALLMLALTTLAYCFGKAPATIQVKPQNGDMTPVVRALLEKVEGDEIKLIFEKGTYRFLPDYASDKYCFITNHENGLKKIIFSFDHFKSVEIDGNGSEFIFHGRVMPFRFTNSTHLKISNISIDWDIPFLFQGDVVAVNKSEGWRDIKPYSDGFSWKLQNGRIEFPNIDGYKFSSLGSSLAFEKHPKKVAHGAWDMSSKPQKVERLPNGNLRFHEHLKHYPTPGTILNSKGPKGENRYAPAFHIVSSKNIQFNNITIHHALGMGFLFERCEDISITKCGIYVKEGSPRVVSIIADATHFCNCKGDILVENCRFEQMLDDGTNVHGTYVSVDKIIDNKSLRFELKHFQQLGFEFAGKGDEIWFIHQPNPQRQSVNTVESVQFINDRFSELTFKFPLPENLKEGDVLENKTWNPTFTMRGCTIQNHRARNIVLKTPLKTVIENNFFSSMMSSVLFRGETFYWYESGNVEDVLIQNNHFKHCAYSGSEHAIMYITPRLGKSFDKKVQYDRNIRFIDNTIETFDHRIVIADRTEGLVIKRNKIIQTNDAPKLYPNAPLFDLINCKNTEIINNSYRGKFSTAIHADKVSTSSLKTKGNKGF